MQIDLSKLWAILEDLRGNLQREVNQAVLNRRTDDALLALGGKDALERLQRDIKSRLGLWDGSVEILSEKVHKLRDFPSPLRTRRGR